MRNQLMLRGSSGPWVAVRLVLVLSMSPSLTSAYSAGPLNGKTGAPGEGTCHDCHFTYDLNSGPGVLAINGPTTFESGQTYEISITLQQSARARWGFEFTPLDVGACTITDADSTQQDVEFGRIYVKHTLDGTHLGDPGPVSWSFDWTAPASPPDTVVFYAAGNAADGNFSRTNDYIYTTAFTTYLAPDVQPPNTIQDLTIDLSGTDVVLNWSDPGDNIGVVGYRVYRSQQAYFSPSGTPLTTVTGLTWTDVGAAGNSSVNYFYNVRAVDGATNEGDPSNSVGEVDYALQ